MQGEATGTAGGGRMRIGDAAAALGVTTRTLRYYEQRGLLTARRTASGHREYTGEDLQRLRMVRGLLEAGLTVEDAVTVLRVLALPPEALQAQECGLVREVVERRLAQLDTRIARLTTLRDRLTERYEARFADVLPSSSGASGSSGRAGTAALPRRARLR